MKKNALLLGCVLLLIFGTCFLAVASSSLPMKKKLIEYGWDRPSPDYVAANITEMEKRPFDGIIMKLAGKGQGKIFSGGKWNLADYAADFEALEKINWNKFTDNFIMMYAASDMDWFSDQNWNNIVNNLKIMTKAAKAGRCNLAFDPEPYGKNPWRYDQQLHADTKSFSDYQAKVRQRGAQFIQAIQKDLPKTVLLTLFTYSIFPDIADPIKREQALRQNHYGLYPAFLTGIMDAMGPGITMTDGNEPSYYYTNSEQFYTAYHRMRQTSLNLIPPDNIDTFSLQTQASQALYFDHLFAKRPKQPKEKILSNFMTEQEQLKWWEHNVYYALKTSDEYIWLYSNHINWWKDEGLPDGMEDAIISARDKIAQQKPLGFNIDKIIANAQKKQREAKETKEMTTETNKTEN